jgi:hypothetical protein
MRVPQVSERIKEAPAQALRGVFAGIGQLLLITDKLRNKAPAGQDVPRARTSEASGTVTATTAARPAGQREEAAASAESAAAEPVTSATAPAASATAPAATAAADEAAAAESVAAESAAAKSAGARRAPTKPATARPATKPTAKPTTARRSPARPASAKPAPAEAAAGEPPKPPKRQSTRDFDKTGNVRLLGEADSSPLSAAEPEAVTTPEPVSGPADSAPPLPNYDELSVASLRARLRNLDVAQVTQLADYERAHAARADVLAMFERRIAKLEAEA